MSFLYSQDLSNCTTVTTQTVTTVLFLYSQDLSNCTTVHKIRMAYQWFLYSQDLSNCTTGLSHHSYFHKVFVLSRFK